MTGGVVGGFVGGVEDGCWGVGWSGWKGGRWMLRVGVRGGRYGARASFFMNVYGCVVKEFFWGGGVVSVNVFLLN